MDLSKLNEYFELHPCRKKSMELFLNTLLQNPQALYNLVDSSMFFVGKHNIHECFIHGKNGKYTKKPDHENCEDEDVYSGDTEFEADDKIARAVHAILGLDPMKSFYNDKSSKEQQYRKCDKGDCQDSECKYCEENETAEEIAEDEEEEGEEEEEEEEEE